MTIVTLMTIKALMTIITLVIIVVLRTIVALTIIVVLRLTMNVVLRKIVKYNIFSSLSSPYHWIKTCLGSAL